MKDYYMIEVGTTPTMIVNYDPKRTSLIIYNNSSVNVYIGSDTSITTNDGFILTPGSYLAFSKGFGDDPRLVRYAIVESGTAELRIHEERVKE